MLDLDLVEVQLVQSLMNDGNDVVLETYILAYEEINKIFGVLGKVFSFVSSDVTSKISILRSKLNSDPLNYHSVVSMVTHEKESSVITSDPSNGSRTLLRLHRALEFVAEFLIELDLSTGSNISGGVSKAYNSTLAKYHTWLIRQAVGAAMHTLPSKEYILKHINQSDSSITRLVTVIRDVHSAVQAVFEDNSLLQLK